MMTFCWSLGGRWVPDWGWGPWSRSWCVPLKIISLSLKFHKNPSWFSWVMSSWRLIWLIVPDGWMDVRTYTQTHSQTHRPSYRVDPPFGGSTENENDLLVTTLLLQSSCSDVKVLNTPVKICLEGSLEAKNRNTSNFFKMWHLSH